MFRWTLGDRWLKDIDILYDRLLNFPLEELHLTLRTYPWIMCGTLIQAWALILLVIMIRLAAISALMVMRDLVLLASTVLRTSLSTRLVTPLGRFLAIDLDENRCPVMGFFQALT